MNYYLFFFYEDKTRPSVYIREETTFEANGCEDMWEKAKEFLNIEEYAGCDCAYFTNDSRIKFFIRDSKWYYTKIEKRKECVACLRKNSKKPISE